MLLLLGLVLVSSLSLSWRLASEPAPAHLPEPMTMSGTQRLLARSMTTALLLVFAPAAAFAQCLFLGASSTQLVELDQGTGRVIRVIGNLTTSLGSLAQNPLTGIVYGVTSSGGPKRLMIVDPMTGAETLVGSLGTIGFDQGVISDIDFRSDGTLFGWYGAYPDHDVPVTINTSTGARTIIGDSGISTFGGGLAFSSGGTLFLADYDFPRQLRTVNTATGLTTIVATLSSSEFATGRIVAMKFHPSNGGLYAAFSSGPSGTSGVVTINPSNGAITDLGGSSLPGIEAMAFACGAPVPTLPQWMVILLGLVLGSCGAWHVRQHRRVFSGP
jgi:hypothetical protein